MGQYPSPYSPPPQYPLGYSSAPVGDPLAPARRASTMLIVIGAMMVLFATCVGATIFTHSNAEFQQAMDESPFGKSFAPPPGVSLVDVARTFYTSASIGGLVFGVSFLILGCIVRRATRIPMVLAVAVCFGFVTVVLISLVLGRISGSVVLVGAGCTGFLPAIAICFAGAWLIQMLKALPHLEAARQQWQAHYAASQQNQQAYGQGAYGYGYPPAPPPGYGQPPMGGPPVGYGAIPPIGPSGPVEGGPPVRHPPLPPDQGESMKDKG